MAAWTIISRVMRDWITESWLSWRKYPFWIAAGALCSRSSYVHPDVCWASEGVFVWWHCRLLINTSHGSRSAYRSVLQSATELSEPDCPVFLFLFSWLEGWWILGRQDIWLHWCACKPPSHEVHCLPCTGWRKWSYFALPWYLHYGNASQISFERLIVVVFSTRLVRIPQIVADSDLPISKICWRE